MGDVDVDVDVDACVDVYVSGRMCVCVFSPVLQHVKLVMAMVATVDDHG